MRIYIILLLIKIIDGYKIYINAPNVLLLEYNTPVRSILELNGNRYRESVSHNNVTKYYSLNIYRSGEYDIRLYSLDNQKYINDKYLTYNLISYDRYYYGKGMLVNKILTNTPKLLGE
jgi:hypothetical protein